MTFLDSIFNRRRRGQGSYFFKVGQTTHTTLESKEDAIKEFHVMKKDWNEFFFVAEKMIESLELFGWKGSVEGYQLTLFMDYKDGYVSLDEFRKIKKSTNGFRSLFTTMMDLDVYEIDGVKIEDYHRASDVMWNIYRATIEIIEEDENKQ